MKANRDILIIGAGPIGLYAWGCAGMLGLDGYIIESNNQIGGQVMELFPEKNLWDLPGINKITGKELIRNLARQANDYGKNIKLMLETNISHLKKNSDDTFKITLSNNLDLTVKTILITAGNGNFNPIKLGNNIIENEKNYLNLNYFVKNPRKFKDQRIIIFGGGNSALDWANYFVEQNISHKVAVVHRRENYRAQEQNIVKLHTNRITEYKPYEIKNIIVEKNTIKNIIIENVNNKTEINLNNCQYLIQYGTKMAISSVNNLPLDFTNNNKIRITHNGATSMKHIFAAGNCVSYEGKYYNLSTGFGEAMTSLIAISKILHGEKYHPGYLSNKVSA